MLHGGSGGAGLLHSGDQHRVLCGKGGARDLELANAVADFAKTLDQCLKPHEEQREQESKRTRERAIGPHGKGASSQQLAPIANPAGASGLRSRHPWEWHTGTGQVHRPRSAAPAEPRVQQLLRPAASSGGWIQCGGGAQDPRKPRTPCQPARDGERPRAAPGPEAAGEQDRQREIASAAARPPWVTTEGWAGTVGDAENVASGAPPSGAHRTARDSEACQRVLVQPPYSRGSVFCSTDSERDALAAVAARPRWLRAPSDRREGRSIETQEDACICAPAYGHAGRPYHKKECPWASREYRDEHRDLRERIVLEADAAAEDSARHGLSHSCCHFAVQKLLPRSLPFFSRPRACCPPLCWHRSYAMREREREKERERERERRGRGRGRGRGRETLREACAQPARGCAHAAARPEGNTINSDMPNDSHRTHSMVTEHIL